MTRWGEGLARALCVGAVAAMSGPVAGGCAATLGVVRATTGDWPRSTEHARVLEVHGAPGRVVIAEARLETPPRVRCRDERFEPAATVEKTDFGIDTPGRLAIGFVGLSELIGGLLPFALAQDAAGPGDGRVDAGAAVFLGALALDGLATLLLAAAMPSETRVRTETREAWTGVTDACPPGIALAVGPERFPIGPDGTLSDAHAAHLMAVVADTGLPVSLHHGGRVDEVMVPPDLRCAWALTSRGSPRPGIPPTGDGACDGLPGWPQPNRTTR
jgi:hypothetical protein